MKLFYDEALSEFSPQSEYLTIFNQNIQKNYVKYRQYKVK